MTQTLDNATGRTRALARPMFDGFARETIKTSGAEINLVHGGSGPPVLLLHGSPQTHTVWHELAPVLAESHTVVAADLRGYGDSFKPLGGGDHSAYSFRAMAADQVEAMRALGHERFAVVGHDRGARVAHRLARDHSQTVERVAFLDIVPTDYLYAHIDREVAAAYWHWFYLPLPEPIPEQMIEPTAISFLHLLLGSLGSGLDVYAPEALAQYERCFADPAAIHGMCEDYRAAASIDLVHDAVDRDRLIRCPVLLLWGARGPVGELYDPIEAWREYATDVRDRHSTLAISSSRNARVKRSRRCAPSLTPVCDAAGILRLLDGRVVEVRSLEPHDRESLATAIERLSPESRYLRFATPKQRMTDRELDFLLDVDHHRREALLAVDPSTGAGVAVIRYVEIPDESRVAEIAAAVADDWQGLGLGQALLGQLVARAREEGYSTLRANVLAVNNRAIGMLVRAGFVPRPSIGVLREFELESI